MNAASRGRPGHTAVFGVTQFSDWSPKELARLRGTKPANAATGLAVAAAPMCNTPVTCNMAHNVTVPAAFDW